MARALAALPRLVIAACLSACLLPAAAQAVLFQQPAGSPYGIGTGGGILFSANDMAVGDLNGDGRSDVVTVNYEPNSYSVLLAGTGGALALRAGSPFAIGHSANGVALADLDDDGDLDLAVSGSQNGGVLAVYPGNGDGSFAAAPAATLPAGNDPAGMAVGDLDDDGVDDLAVAVYSDDAVRTFRGASGGPAPAAGGTYGVGQSPLAVATGDFNEDGRDDVATANHGSFFGNAASVLLSDGSGGFAAIPGGLGGSYRPGGVAVGRFDSSGHLGFAQANSPNGEVPVKLGRGDGTFADAPGGFLGIASHLGGEIAAADFDRDGLDDLVVPYGSATSGPANAAALFLGRASGQMAPDPGSPFSLAPAGSPLAVGVGDFDGDGRPDFATAGGDAVAVMLNAAPGLSIAPTAGYFVGIPVGTGPSDPIRFTVSSTGQAPLEVFAVGLGGDDPGQFAIDSETCTQGPIPPGSECEVLARFDPTELGERVAAVELTTNLGLPATVPVSGWGTPNARIVLDPEEADFGTVPVGGAAGPTRTFTVGSTGTTPLTIGSVGIAGDDADQFELLDDGCGGRELGPEEECEIEVGFEPASTGAKAAELEVFSDATDGPTTAELSGTGGDAPIPGIALDPAAAEFGRIVVGEGPSAARRFTVTSDGTAPLNVGAVGLEGADADQFRVLADGCAGRQLAPAESCGIELAFAPSAAGAKAARLAVGSDAAGGTVAAGLTGTADAKPDPCEPVSVRRVAKYEPAIVRRWNAPGVRARFSATGRAVVKARARVSVRAKGGPRSFRTAPAKLKVTGRYRNYKVALPRKLRGKVRLGSRATMTITYSARALRGGCGFGPVRTRTLHTRVVRVRTRP